MAASSTPETPEEKARANRDLAIGLPCIALGVLAGLASAHWVLVGAKWWVHWLVGVSVAYGALREGFRRD